MKKDLLAFMKKNADEKKAPKAEKVKKVRNAAPAGETAVKYKRASTKISAVAITGFVLAVVMLMVSVIATVATSATGLTNHIFFAVAEANANYVGDVLGAADDTASLMQNYLSMSYDAEKRGASTSSRTSKVYDDLKLGTYTYERESVLLNTMWSTVSANEAILNMGALFERYAFDKGRESYTIVITEEDAAAQTARTYSEHSAYSRKAFILPAPTP